MTVEASFVMTLDGKYLGKDIEFNFSGDDDLWVFVDGVLVLDIGGVHNPVTGKINFNSGEVIVRDGVHNTDPDQLVVNDSKPGPNTIQEAFSRVTGKEWDDSPYTRHTLRRLTWKKCGMTAMVM
jgi:fibro-slime domain-containing protein